MWRKRLSLRNKSTNPKDRSELSLKLLRLTRFSISLIRHKVWNVLNLFNSYNSLLISINWLLFFVLVPEKEEDLDDETHALLQADWEIGEVIRQSIVPRAVLFFTGEALDEDYDDEEDEEEEEEDDEDSDADEDYSPPKGGKKGGKNPPTGGGKHAKGANTGEKPPECKQQ